MAHPVSDLEAFLSVARAGGFREAARATGSSASQLSEAVRRLESRLGARLFNRTTRSVVVTDAGRLLRERAAPALHELDAALEAVHQLGGRPAGVLRLNVPVSAARLVLPSVLPGFLAAFPEIEVEVTTDSGFVDVVAAGCDAGIRYEERLEQDMIAVPIGARLQRMATAAAPAYLDEAGRPDHPQALLAHRCIRSRFPSGAVPAWDFERGAERVTIVPRGPLRVDIGGGLDLAVDVAIAGGGVIHLFEDWLRPYFERGALEPLLTSWWPAFPGPFLYYPGRRHVPAPLKAFVTYLRTRPAAGEVVGPPPRG